MTTGYQVPETESLTEDQAGAEILKLAKSFRPAQGQTESGTQSAAANATATDDEPEAEVEDATPPEAASEEIEATDETPADETADVEPPATPRGRKLKLGDREEFVSEDEAYNGYLRQADYTRKTQAIAAAQKEHAKALEAAAQRREQYDAGLKQIEDALVVMMPREPDWDRVRAEHPAEYPQLFTDWQRYQQRLNLVKSERARVDQERQADEASKASERRKEAADRLLEVIPEWKDPSKRDADRVKLSSLAHEFGYSEQEIAAIEDPRQVLLLRDALRYKELLAKQAKAKAAIGKAPVGATKTATPGTAGAITRTTTTSQAAKAAKSRLAKTGNVDDAAEAIFQTLRAGPKKR